jgi:ABC-type bacteriocin/lantibiotic exporter with double-glycine peptidase domain
MQNSPRTTFRCGIRALEMVGNLLTPDATFDARLRAEPAGNEGLSFADLMQLSKKYQLPMLPVEISPNSDLIVPSVAHLKLAHFAAILKQDGSRYWVDDPVFRNPRWIKAEVLRAESSGRYLIPARKLAMDVGF